MTSKFHLRLLDEKIRLEHFNNPNDFIYHYLQLLTNGYDGFLSMTRNNGRYTLMSEDIGEGDCGRYMCMELTTCNPGLYESDILAPVTQLFSQHKIPILCISTFTSNFILFEEEHYVSVTSFIEGNVEFEISI